MQTETTKQTAQRVIDSLFPCAAAIVAKGQEHQPMLVLNWQDDAQTITPLPPMSKDDAALLHRVSAQHPKIAAATLIMEAWVATGKQSEGGGLTDDPALRAVAEGKVAVSDLPERGEAILFSIRVGRDQFIAMCKIDRATNTLEKCASLLDCNGATEYAEGRFAGEGRPFGTRAKAN